MDLFESKSSVLYGIKPYSTFRVLYHDALHGIKHNAKEVYDDKLVSHIDFINSNDDEITIKEKAYSFFALFDMYMKKYFFNINIMKYILNKIDTNTLRAIFVYIKNYKPISWQERLDKLCFEVEVKSY